MQFHSLKWEKLGLIFSPGKYDWMRTHIQNPIPVHIECDVFRIHFSSRDSKNRAHGGFFDIDISVPNKIINLSQQPSIGLGDLGCFDDSGVMPSSLVNVGNSSYLYYTGWSRTVDVPFAFHIGLAVSNDGVFFQRHSLAPVLGRNGHDPYITGAPFVLYEDGLFRMWYISGTKWERDAVDSKPKHYYTVKYAESDDGINWQTNNALCIDYAAQEYAIARPVVLRENSGYVMWFTYRGGNDTYRIGAAHSSDGRTWEREPGQVKIDVSDQGWDSEMICYGYPFIHNGTLYALYNGNSYGATGVGLAVAQI